MNSFLFHCSCKAVTTGRSPLAGMSSIRSWTIWRSVSSSSSSSSSTTSTSSSSDPGQSGEVFHHHHHQQHQPPHRQILDKLEKCVIIDEVLPLLGEIRLNDVNILITVLGQPEGKTPGFCQITLVTFRRSPR